MSRINKTTTLRKKGLIIGLAAFVIGLVLIGILEKTGRINLYSSKPTTVAPTSTATSDDSINFNPPTEEDKQNNEEHKETLKDVPAPSPQSSTSTKKTVKPIIVSASNGTLKGFVPEILENDGTCTALFTKDGQTKERTSTGFADVNKTTCRSITYSTSEIGTGWSVTLRYQSIAAEGVSDAFTLQ
jgi:hypothetical protein